MAKSLFLLLVLLPPLTAAGESLPPITTAAPKNVEELWGNYDPAREPLEVQVLHEWEKDGITTQMLIYTVGTFKGSKSRMGAYYARPTRVSGKIPGILHMHGGGQRAQRQSVEPFAANGYAAITINWGGRAMEDQKPGEPGTDWGALDATQTSHNSHYFSQQPDARTIDSIVSPRNSNWFVITLAARRALTFLQQQSQVDPEKLGVTGHSMGGKLTVLTAGADPRVKAAVPSCGGSGDATSAQRAIPGAAFRPVNREPLHDATIDDLPYLRRITCPLLYLGPHNDFNANLDHLYENWKQIPSRTVGFSISPHFNHRHVPESSFAGVHFFDVHLKNAGNFPGTPGLRVDLRTDDHVPRAVLSPDRADEVSKVEIFYSIDPHALTRFWRTAPATRSGTAWTARLPLLSTALPIHVMANVYYRLPRRIAGAPWEGRSPETFLVSSWGVSFQPAELQAAGVVVTDTADRLIESDFGAMSDWYHLERGNSNHRQSFARKVKDPKWRGPDGARLAIDVLDPVGGQLVLAFEMNGWNAYAGVRPGSYYAARQISASPDWQTLEFSLAELKPLDDKSPKSPASWQFLTELGIVARASSRSADGKSQVLAGGSWPASRQLRNLRWVGGQYPARMLLPVAGISEEEYRRTFQAQIDKSVELEKRDARPADR